MKSFSENPRPPEGKISFSKYPALTEIPSDIRRQEEEIESILRSLAHLRDSSDLYDSEEWLEHIRNQERLAWVFVAVLGLISMMALYLLLNR